MGVVTVGGGAMKRRDHQTPGLVDPIGDVGSMTQKSQRLSAMAEAAGRDPAEILRASALSLEDEPDVIARNIEAWEQAGFGYLVCGWPAGGRTTVEAFAHRFLD